MPMARLRLAPAVDMDYNKLALFLKKTLALLERYKAFNVYQYVVCHVVVLLNPWHGMGAPKNYTETSTAVICKYRTSGIFAFF